jgi:hypothetical protein
MRRASRAFVLVAAATVSAAGVAPAGSGPAGASPAAVTSRADSAAAAAPAAPDAPARPEVRADFDGDGAQDLAVGVPFESVGTVFGAGAVNVLFGVPGANLAGAGSQLFTQDTAGLGSNAEVDDRFGDAMTVGDFDGDGLDDLAVGASGETVGTVEFAGSVNVIYGSAGGLNNGRPSQLFTQANVGVGLGPEAFDFFGTGLTAGDLDGDGVDDLAIGAPGAAIGPDAAAGLVNVVFGSPGGLGGGLDSRVFSQDSPGVGGDAEQSDSFGSVLTTGDVDASGIADLVVGAPGEAVGTVTVAGAINVLFGATGGPTGAGQLLHQGTTGIGSDPEEFDQFGSALDAGDFDGNGQADIAVGAPGESVGTVEGAGALNVIFGGPGGLNAGRPSQVLHQGVEGVGSDPEFADFFGAAVAAGDFDDDGADDLGVGVPLENVGTVEFGGTVNVLYGGSAGITGTGSQLFHQGTNGVISDPEQFDSFGFSLTVGDFGGDGPADLAIGVPGESAGTIEGAGAINVLRGSANGLAGADSQLFHQGSPGIGSDPEAFDDFGLALAAPGSQSVGGSSTSSASAATAAAVPLARPPGS